MKLNLPGNNSAIVIENVFIKLVSIRESKGSSGREDMPNTNDPLASDVRSSVYQAD